MKVFVHLCRNFKPFLFFIELLLAPFDLFDFHTTRKHQTLKPLNMGFSFADVKISSTPPIEIHEFSSECRHKRLNVAWRVVSSGEVWKWDKIFFCQSHSAEYFASGTVSFMTSSIACSARF